MMKDLFEKYQDEDFDIAVINLNLICLITNFIINLILTSFRTLKKKKTHYGMSQKQTF